MTAPLEGGLGSSSCTWLFQHDCRNNVEFQLQATSMSFKVVEEIEEGEQLFTHYGSLKLSLP